MHPTKSSNASLCASDMLEQLVLAGGGGVEEEEMEVISEGGKYWVAEEVRRSWL